MRKCAFKALVVVCVVPGVWGTLSRLCSAARCRGHGGLKPSPECRRLWHEPPLPELPKCVYTDPRVLYSITHIWTCRAHATAFVPVPQRTCSPQAPGSGRRRSLFTFLRPFMQRCIFIRETHLGDPVVPAHPPEACSSQDDGGEVLLLVQLLQTSVEIPTLGLRAQENTWGE